jgi:Bacteriophage replication gene A protein (GPA)
MRDLNFGIPTRMAKAMYKVFMRDGQEQHQRKVDLLDTLLCDDQRIPLATDTGAPTGEPAIWHAADAAARECYAICQRVVTADAIKIAIGMVCRRRGVSIPQGETMVEIIARAVDKAWWRRNLRTEWKRRFEHTAIQLGLTYVRTDPYVSRETAIMQETQNRANQKLLEQRIATNEFGDSYTVAELAALGVGNKAIRRGELMLRIRGFEEVAETLGDIGMFWTVTCPSKFHSVGGTNDKYNGATPRDAQAYLVKVWARIRAALHREDIRPYGFRIAEPHSDGCPHWHMLLFVAPGAAERMEAIVNEHALAEDGHEKGAQANRVKLVRIEAGKGTAAGYIAKYVSKNIDGAGVGDHKTFEDGRTYVVAPDIFGDMEITPSQRVTYWSQVWGIRQFQQIGGAPVGVWRELRRVKAETIQDAPEAIKAAHRACQKIDSDDAAVAKQADFGAYMLAQGGPTVGRRAAIKIAAREVTIKGRYATYTAPKPVGVYAAAQPGAVYEGVHYRWTIDGAGAGVAFELPRTGVNNCTESPSPYRWNAGVDGLPDSFVAAPIRKKFAREQWAASENRGDGKGGEGWSKRADADKVDRFKNRSAKHAETHLQHLMRKYDA